MTTPHTSGMHPLLSSVVHLPFHTAAKQVGCCELAQKDFSELLEQHISSFPDIAVISEIEGFRLWKGMMNGEVLAVEYIDNEAFLFHVRGRVVANYIDMRFYYHKDTWQIQAVTSIHHRPFWRSRWRSVTEISAGVVIVAILSTLLFQSHYTRQGVESWAQHNGYKLVSSTEARSVAPATGSEQSNAKAASAGATNTTTSTSGNTSTANTTSSTTATTASAPQTYTFKFKSGMSVHDISVFLAKHNLVSNAYAFDSVLHKTGVEKAIWPGTYVFKSNMNQSQILTELKSKP